MEDLSSRTVTCFDYGLFVSWAPKLAEYFGRVFYFCPWQSAFPSSKLHRIGSGIGNIIKVDDFWDVVPETDVFFFPDVYTSGIQKHLRGLGYPVWGCGDAERLELERWETKEFLKDLGLPVQHCEHIYGIEELRAYLMSEEDKYVKISKLRGDFETFHHTTYNLSEPILDDIEMRLGPFKDEKEFIVEDAINDAVETGFDGFTVDGQFPDPCVFGYEIKDVSYIGVINPYSRLPRQVKETNAALAPTFQECTYRGFWSSELRIVKDGTAYLTDPCCRAGSPPSELYQEMWKNWGEIIWHGAHGEMVTPQPVAKYGVEVLLHSAWADSHWQAVFADPEIRKWIKLRNMCVKNDTMYVAPQIVGLPEIGAVIAVEDTLMGAIKKVVERCKGVTGYEIDMNIDKISKAIDTIKEGEKAGINLFGPLPSKGEIAAALSK